VLMLYETTSDDMGKLAFLGDLGICRHYFLVARAPGAISSPVAGGSNRMYCLPCLI
jgi:hypothetical protein